MCGVGTSTLTCNDLTNAVNMDCCCRHREALVYQMAAVGATFLVSSMAIVATYLRYHFIMEGQEVNWIEIMASLSLVCGGVVSLCKVHCASAKYTGLVQCPFRVLFMKWWISSDW